MMSQFYGLGYRDGARGVRIEDETDIVCAALYGGYECFGGIDTANFHDD